MQDTPKHSGIQDRCFKPMSPLQPNVEWTYSAIDGLKTDCPSSGAHELGYVLGWVAHHWANFTPPSDVTVSRHLLFTVDQAIRSGTFMPNYDREDLLCDSSVDDSYLPFAGQVIRDANVRSPRSDNPFRQPIPTTHSETRMSERVHDNFWLVNCRSGQ